MSIADLAWELAQEHLEKARIQSEAFIYSACPFHNDNKPSFYISRTTGSWNCWSCHTSGSSLEELLKALGVKGSYKVHKEIAQLKKEAKKAKKLERLKKEAIRKKTFKAKHVLPEDLLGVYDWTPTSLVETFGVDLLEDHQIGFDQIHNRVTYPIRDIHGNLIGISGRKLEKDYGPKYKIYNGVHQNMDGIQTPGELGEWYPWYSAEGIKDHLWRGERVFWEIYEGRMNDLIITEGFKAALWLVLCGYENVVALMQSKMTAAQEALIRRMGTPTWIFLDNDTAGRSGAEDAAQRLGNAPFPVYITRYPEWASSSAQPDDLDESTIDRCLFHAEVVVSKSRHRYRRKSFARV